MAWLGIEDASLRSQVARALRRDGVSEVVAGNGQLLMTHAWTATSSGPGRVIPDVIVADARLLGGSGIPVLEQLRGLGLDTPIILVTELGDDRARSEAWSHGVTGVFVRPFDVDVLCLFIKSVLDEKPPSAA